MSESAPSPGSSRLDQVLSGDMPWWAISLRGMAMGAADVVPGVSGGTMALILGVYTRFIDALRSLNGALLKEVLVFLKAGLGAEARPRFWAAVRGADTFFLAFLGAGVVTAIASFSKVIPWLIDHYPAHMNGLFFGMIAASTMVPFRMMERRGAVQLVAFVLATAFAFWFSGLPVLNVEASLPFLFVCGAIAICAMMLPGVSGSFLLLVLGQYTYVLTALKNLDLAVIMVFGAGCATGLLSFSRLLSWLLHRYQATTLAALCGLMVGSLQKVWPFKDMSAQIVVGKKVVSAGANVLPTDASYTGAVALPLALMVVGLIAVVVLEKVGAAKGKPAH